MHPTHMLCQARFMCEACTADLAWKWLLTSVASFMGLQTIFPFEPLSALPAYKLWVLVLQHVKSQLRFIAGGFTTNLALKFPILDVKCSLFSACFYPTLLYALEAQQFYAPHSYAVPSQVYV